MGSEAVVAAADILRLVGNPNRLAILCRLAEGEASVGEMEAKLGIRQPTLSQQLGELRKAGLIEDRREAKVVFYCLADERVRSIVDHVRELFSTRKRSQAKPEARRVRPTREPSISPCSYASVFARVLKRDSSLLPN